MSAPLPLPRRDRVPPAEFLVLPKIDLHSHNEVAPWFDRVLASREGREPHDFTPGLAEARSLVPPSLERLRRLGRELDAAALDALDRDGALMIARFEAHMRSAAEAGAVLLEIKVGGEGPLLPHFEASFRAAEARVQAQHPRFFAEALFTLNMQQEPSFLANTVDRVLAVRQAFAGVDIIPWPYDDDADAEVMISVSARFANAGLGITCHAGEFSAANLKTALSLPGLTRLGHAAFAEQVPGALEEIIQRGLLVEVCLTGNVALGTAPSYEAHHLQRFLDRGVRVALGSDNPVKIFTTIAHEYWYAAQLGVSMSELQQITADAVASAFTSAERRRQLQSFLS